MSDFDILSEAIKKQRWYFFENNDKIIFDRDTGLIWTNLKYFPYRKKDTLYYQSSEVKNFVSTINFQNWGGYNNWQIPDPFELWKMIEDKTFPFQEGNYWRIMKHFGWCVNNSGVLSRKDLDYSGALAGITADSITAVILCSNALRPVHFSSESRAILDIFKSNKLVPKFDDEKANSICKKFLGGKIKLSLNVDLSNLNFDFSKYDAAAINQSPIKFYKAVASAADEILNYLQRYKKSTADIFNDFSKLMQKLNAQYFYNSQLSQEENILLKRRREILAKLLKIGVEEVTAQILSVKSEVENLAARRENILRGENILAELADFENEKRVSFNFLVENIVESVQLAQDKIQFFAENEKFIEELVDAPELQPEGLINFKTNWRAQFENLCRKNRIEEKIYSEWYDDWKNLHAAIENNFLPLAEFALKGNLLKDDAALKSLEVLREYKKAVDNFYLNETVIQRRLDVEENPRKFIKKFFEDLQKIVSACEKLEERIFLKNWAETLTKYFQSRIVKQAN